MQVIKRSGKAEPVRFDKILTRLQALCEPIGDYPALHNANAHLVARRVIGGIVDKLRTSELDELSAECSAQLTSTHYEYGMLAARITVSNLQKDTPATFTACVRVLSDHVDESSGARAPLLSEELRATVEKHGDRLDASIRDDRDFMYDYFGIKTLERAYLLRAGKRIVERPQYMLMRVALGIHGDNIENVLRSYDLMSEGMFTHASPTLFNAGRPQPGLSSCFLLSMKSDSIEGIYETLKQCAMISKSAGGIGLAVHDIRASGSYIKGTGGVSNGLVPMLRVFNNTARYVDQGGGKRKGAFAVYLEPWHADVMDFLELKKTVGVEELRAKDLFFGLWIPDLFMERVRDEGMWHLMCPSTSPGLCDVYGDEFRDLYERYVREGRYVREVPARTVWSAMIVSGLETGGPYMLYKDACNRKSNQKNLGVIRSSNLCTEIVEYTSPDEVAVCNLASLGLPRFVRGSRFHGGGASPTFDHALLAKVVGEVVRNLNLVIDRTDYPVEEARRSNLRHRPVGIGVQGLADVFMMMDVPYTSAGGRELNRQIFETIYYEAVNASCTLAERDGPYETFEGSPASLGQLQFDMWGVVPSDRFDWTGLKARVRAKGLRNSLLVAPMPTASTSQILGHTESFEPLSSNLYVRKTLAGEFTVVNRYLMQDLMREGLWTPEMQKQLVAANGSVQHIKAIPAHMRELYRTVWEMKGRTLIDMAADRGAYICQSQSFNFSCAKLETISAYHMYGWKKGLKTGMYYMRTQETTSAQKPMHSNTLTIHSGEVDTHNPPTITAEEWRVQRRVEQDAMQCKIKTENGKVCNTCSS